MPPRNRKRGGATGRSYSNNNETNSKNKSDNNNYNNRSNTHDNRSKSGGSGNNNNKKKSNAQERRPPVRALPEQSNEDPSTICSVCANKAADWAIGPCRHHICGDCMHRMRVLYGRKTCVICSQPQCHLVVIPLSDWRETLSYEDACAIPNLTYDSDIDMSFVDPARLTQLRAVRGFKCSHKACVGRPASETVFANSTQLRAHARTEHHAIYCDICMKGERAFVSELQQYPLDQGRNASSSLRGHLRKTHPQCQFCKTFYLDDDKLYAHLQEAHETCSICERNGRIHEYYLNFSELERHYDKEHFTCNDEGCRGVVFPTAIELQAHQHLRHGAGGIGAAGRSRALRVNLQQLHEGGNSRSAADEVARERQHQMARRRAFLSTQAVFAGALNLDDTATDVELPFIDPDTSASTATIPRTAPAQQPGSSSAPQSSTVPRTAARADPELPPRPPDDGKFHPTRLPRDASEAQARNAVLVRRMRSKLDPAAYELFRQSSARFHDGSIDGDAFYDEAIDAFGFRAAIRDILPELVSLLPSALLRKDLARVCFRRTGTPDNEAAGLLEGVISGASSTPAGAANTNRSDGDGSPSGAENSDRAGNAGGAASGGGTEQFPTLNGGPAPPVRAPRLRRFGAPGPEEFPRLGKANNNTDATKNEIGQSNNDASSRPKPSSSSGRTVASALKESGIATPARIFGNRGVTIGGSGATSTAGSSTAPAASSSASVLTATKAPVTSVSPVPTIRNMFPALPSRGSGPSTGGGGSGSSTMIHHQPSSVKNSSITPLSQTAFPALGGSSTQAGGDVSDGHGDGPVSEEEGPSADVSLRAGAVWGGAAGQAYGEKKKRGPGQGRGRRPATPPRLAFPSLPTDSESAPAVRKSTVVDIRERERERLKALQQSSLPKIGGSGYGFAWERKKAQQKRKEIRSGAGGSNTGMPQPPAGASS